MTMQLIPGRRGLVAVRADAGNAATLITELNKTVADFRAEIESKVNAKADVVVVEKIDRMQAAIGDLQGAIDEAHLKIAAAQLAPGGKSVRDPDYNKAFSAHVRKGDVQASLNKGAAAEGGFVAPVEWDRTITDRLVILSPMRQIARVQQIGGPGFSRLFNNRGMGSGWVGETAVRPETTTPTMGSLTYSIGEIYANPSATQQILDDAEVDLEQFIADNVETEFALQEGIAFVAGNGTNKPAGFLTYATGAANAAVHPWGAIQVRTAAAAAAVTTDEVLRLTYDLPQAYTGGARFVMNRGSLANVRTLKDAGGNYIWQPTFTEGQPQTLAGYPITELAAMPNMTTGAIPIAFGDFQRGYLIIDRIGVRVLRDPYTNKPYVMFYTTKRVGGGLNDPDAIKVLKMA
ncbi:MAG TPA: phage major capsid protein [Microvirga sp.]|jgi:HK97 family phage major capsid protein|nr:phage major capsid protein [Microvirga sp.]